MRGQGRLFKRGAVWWIAYYHRGRELRESSKSPDPRKARALLKERLRKAGTPEFIGPAAERLTFDDLAAMYLTDYKVNAKRSHRDAARNVERLRVVFGFDRALDITADRIAAYAVQRLEDGMAPASINRELAALRRMFSLAVKAGKLGHRPHVAMLAEENARQGFLEPADFAAVRAHLPAYLSDAATFAYLTGWRKGEVRTLEWRDVDLSADVIRLRAEHSKNKRPRLLALRGELRALVERRAAVRRLECPYVFHRDGRPLGDFRKAWRAACQAAGVGGRIFHDMRRSAVRNMVRAGVPERVAMAVSGHRTRAIFDRYNIVSEEDLAAAVERTDAYVTERREAGRRVVALDAVRGREDGQNTDNRAGENVAVNEAPAVST
jgi:integrase